MRPSNRTAILEAAVRVAARDGIRGMTLEATAEEAALTRGGVSYHFRSKEALNLALQEHLAAKWEAELEEAAGGPAHERTPSERLAAYARASSRSIGRAELVLLLQSATDPEHDAPWLEVDRRWTPSPDAAAADDEAFALFTARLLADGLWSYESVTGEPLPASFRRRVAEHIAATLPSASPSA